MIVSLSHKPVWLVYQIFQLALATIVLSFPFNYAYRFTIDRSINSAIFYLVTLALGLITFVALRRDYIFINKYEFTEQVITTKTALGITRQYSTQKYKFVPSLHKTLNWPESRASLSFYVRDISTGRNVRNYSWKGFSDQDFTAASHLYGYQGDIDFKLKELFGKRSGYRPPSV